MQFGDLINRGDLPDRTSYMWFANDLEHFRVLQTGLTMDDITAPGYEDGLRTIAEANREAWGIPTSVEVGAAYTFAV